MTGLGKGYGHTIHSDQQDDLYNDSYEFWASSSYEYSVSYWFSSRYDEHASFGGASGSAENNLFAKLAFIVFELWT